MHHLDKFIAYMKSKPGVWFATGEQIARCVDHALSILDDANQLEFVGKDALESFHHDPVVVGEHNARACHAVACTGTQATTEVP